MSTRTTSKTVTFVRPFVLENFPELLPAGDYVVDTEEEALDSMLSQGWRRVSTTMRVRVDGAVEMRSVDPDALQDALLRDRAKEEPMKKKADRNIAFRLSRVEAAGWKEAQRMMTDNALSADEERIALLNPHGADPERARWRLGFTNALNAGGCP